MSYDVDISIKRYQIRFVPQNDEHTFINIWDQSTSADPDARLYFSGGPFKPAVKAGTVYNVFYSSAALSGMISTLSTFENKCILRINSNTGDRLLETT